MYSESDYTNLSSDSNPDEKEKVTHSFPDNQPLYYVNVTTSQGSQGSESDTDISAHTRGYLLLSDHWHLQVLN